MMAQSQAESTWDIYGKCINLICTTKFVCIYIIKIEHSFFINTANILSYIYIYKLFDSLSFWPLRDQTMYQTALLVKVKYCGWYRLQYFTCLAPTKLEYGTRFFSWVWIRPQAEAQILVGCKKYLGLVGISLKKGCFLC